MKLSRLVQPRNPAFWLMIAFNVLSSLFAWGMRALPLTPVAQYVFAALALANVAMGILMAWRLLRTEPEAARGRDA